MMILQNTNWKKKSYSIQVANTITCYEGQSCGESIWPQEMKPRRKNMGETDCSFLTVRSDFPAIGKTSGPGQPLVWNVGQGDSDFW